MRVTRTVPLLASVAVAASVLGVAPAGAAPFKTPKVRGDIAGPPAIKVLRGEDVAPTLAAAKRLRRGILKLSCASVPDDRGGSSSESTSVPLRRRGTRLTIPANRDYCVVSLERRSGDRTSYFSLGAVVLTTEGDEYLYERSVTGIMAQVSALTFGGEDAKPQTVAQIIDQLRDMHVAGRPLTALATLAPRTPVAVDQLGIWTDGTRTSVTATTPAGRHLYLDQDRSTKDLSTNVFPALTDDSLDG